MDKLLIPGRIMYAISMATLGVLCIQYKNFLVGRPAAWSASFLAHPILAFISGAILIIASVAIILKKKPVMAALIIATEILLLSVSRHLPHFFTDWINGYKTIALVGGSVIIAASFSVDDSRESNMFSKSTQRDNVLTVIGFILLSIYFIACGIAHFKWADGVQYFIREYIPYRLFWTYFTGCCLLAGGIGLLIPQTRRWAAFMSGIMIFGWFLLLHLPEVIQKPNDYNARLGVCESFLFPGICIVLAASISRRASPRG